MEVAALYLYPIKGCRGVRVESSRTTPAGLRYDRQWMLVETTNSDTTTDNNDQKEESTFRFVTQREYPSLVLVEPTIREDLGVVEVVAPSQPRPLRIPLDSCRQAAADARRYTVRLWKEFLPAVDVGDEAARWFSAYLGSDVRLVAKMETVVRPLPAKYLPVPTVAFPFVPQTGFADAWPFLLLSEASVADVNARMDRPVECLNFRPSIVVRGCAPFAEDTWREIVVGEERHRLFVVCRCTRCMVTTVDLRLGTKSLNTLDTLQTFRRVDAGKPNKACVGMYAVPFEPSITVSVGDRVEVVQMGEHMLKPDKFTGDVYVRDVLLRGKERPVWGLVLVAEWPATPDFQKLEQSLVAELRSQLGATYNDRVYLYPPSALHCTIATFVNFKDHSLTAAEQQQYQELLVQMLDDPALREALPSGRFRLRVKDVPLSPAAGYFLFENETGEIDAFRKRLSKLIEERVPGHLRQQGRTKIPDILHSSFMRFAEELQGHDADVVSAAFHNALQRSQWKGAEVDVEGFRLAVENRPYMHIPFDSAHVAWEHHFDVNSH